MTEKPSMRLKFKDSPSPTSTSAQPVAVSKPHPPVFGTEPVMVKCGHSIAFDLYVKDPFREQRRAKAVARDCAPCRQDRAKAEELAAKDRRRAKKAVKAATFAKALKPRLPDGSHFAATFDAAAVKWTGTLTVDGATFPRQGSSLNKLLHKLDDVYRASLLPTADVGQELAPPT